MKVIYEGKEIVLEAKNGFDLVKALAPEEKKSIVGIVVNGEVRDLRRAVEDGAEIRFVKMGDKEAFEMLNHSTSHLMAEALQNLYPGCKFGFGPAIEEGFYYDVDFGERSVSEADFPAIEAEMKRLAKQANPFVREEVSAEEALRLFAENPYKVELIREHMNELITTYKQGGFLDFCRGPHIPDTGLIKHFKLTAVAGAYWRGNSDNKQLTRLYGTSWWSEEDLKNYLEIVERRKKNDHRRLGRELGLFFLSDYGPGFPFFLPKGMLLKNALLDYWRKVHRRHGYLFIETPTMLSRELWETSGHWDHYKENMYTTKIDDRDFAIKPMNCPGSILCYQQAQHSYREFPIRYAELGHVHRHEASGALNGLFRVRAFTQDDAHIFIRPDQVEDEVRAIMRLFDEVYEVFGLDYRIVLSTRPDDYIGDEEYWKKSEEALAKACKDSGHEFSINPGDGAFYGPKLDFKLKDSMGRTWQCGTIQLDVNLPHRFGCFYIDENGEKKEPYLLHRVVFGSVERFIGIITENFGGAFPTWIAPVQVRILPVNDEVHGSYAQGMARLFEKEGIRAEIDNSNEKLGYRLRKSQVEKIPFTIVVGDKEKDEGLVTYRLYGKQEQITVTREDFLAHIKDVIAKKERF